MTQNWSRRALLAALGSVGSAALAGCGNLADGSQSSSPTETPTATARSEPAVPDSIDSDWPVPAADPGRSNHVPGRVGPTEDVDELWATGTDTTLSGPVVADETAYVGGRDGTVRAVNARTGDTRWTRSVGAAAATPWAVEDSLYVPTADGVVALAADGTERWRHDVGEPMGFVAADHGVYVLHLGDPPVVVGYDRGDGTERWRTDLREPMGETLFATDDAVVASSGHRGTYPWRLDPETGEESGPELGPTDRPVERFVVDDTVYSAFFGVVEAHPLTEDGGGWSRAFGTGQLVAGGARHVYAASRGDDGGLTALAPEDGTTEWEVDVGAGAARPVVTDAAVVVRTDGAVRCFDPVDGTERWQRTADGIGEQFVVVDDLLVTTDGGTVRAFRPL
ncbi:MULTISPECIES: PQQ-binding-like beta-propeller repeat protein [Salinibaculum]|uniref:PQQ-binding-like beta-propeller repeat protein n=1 Tax=Salinibaculum TaxID=2732368 RepID=UPI0030D28361